MFYTAYLNLADNIFNFGLVTLIVLVALYAIGRSGGGQQRRTGCFAAMVMGILWCIFVFIVAILTLLGRI